MIDDDPLFAEMLTGNLNHEYHSVVSAIDGASALKLAHEEKPDLFLIDVRLPDMDGFELCKKLRADPDLCYAPILMITGFDSPDIHLRCVESGAIDVLAKPIDFPVLRALVSALLKYHNAVVALRSAHNEVEKRVQDRTAELSDANIKLKKEATYRNRVELALRESDERYALAARGANDGMWDWKLDSKTVYYSPRWKSMLGYDESESLSERIEEWFERVHPDDIAALNSSIDAHLKGDSELFRMEYRMLCSDGTYRWMVSRAIAVKGPNGNISRMAGSQTDIHERKMAEQQLLHNAFHDELTGLPNRVLFMDRLDQALKRIQLNENLKLAVFFLDVDRFKFVNESTGREAGDQLLVEFGRRLQACLRPTDTVARLGGDEFAVLLEDIKSLVNASALANSIHEALRQPFILAKRDVIVTSSVGIVLGRREYTRPDDILRDAETAMHQAKSMGKARQETFHSGMHAQVVTLSHLESDLRRAVDSNEFHLQYQPIAGLNDGKIAGFEALIRWKHPQRGLISPAEFIPLAEETDVITPISLWVLREACGQLRTWHARMRSSALSMSVNLSGNVFSNGKFIQQMSQILGSTDVPGSRLKIELTESVIMEHSEASMAFLAQLAAMNVQLVIDDFGTGYSSLSYLCRLPINVLKIDRSFVSSMHQGAKHLAIVRTIIALARNLEMKVVAEGVETAQQLAMLRELKCDYAQGYFLARPLDAAAADKLLASDPTF